MGSLVPRVALKPGTKVVGFTAEYLSEFGELIVARELNAPIALPMGRYRVLGVTLKLAGDDAKVWHYTFNSDARDFGVNVERGLETARIDRRP